MTDRMCPYPGLRPFSEDEAIYFQGREENVSTIATVLEQNHFLMLAGSSGDGKSSLVFAGLVPHCRAGFFRAAYPGWAVAVFRPERSPLERLAHSLAEALGLEPGPVESSLRHGFSALVDLYLSSPAVGGYEEDASGKPALAVSQNLLIVADQFEELFTNPENFVGGAPSSEARLCVNLLLETARLALANDLPIYVVCTMRSDYIGQCNAFTGLPEMIGFSHYFVPRLTRAQLRRVVLEPARLNGDDIAPRLAERMIYDLQEGEDQLPLLQHALAAVWRQADADNTNLDLLAYHRCGGMPAEELPPDQLLPGMPAVRPLEDEHAYGLGAVLNRHAGKLFKHAALDENNPEAARILARAFTCLTGQDNGRMVRNRMSIAQMARTIEPDKAAWPTLEQALARMFVPFRSMAAGFVRPLIQEGESDALDRSAPLDITHEALIRNWDQLKDWTLAEHRRLTTWRELEPQVQRWVAARQAADGMADFWTRSMSFSTLFAGKGSTYLLPIGPLTYFEKWQDETSPTAEWILRYSAKDGSYSERTERANAELAQAEDFMARSKRRLAMTRKVAEVGMGKVMLQSLIVGAVFGICMSGVKAYRESNGRVADKARKDASEIFVNPIADRGTRSAYLLNAYATGLKDGLSQADAVSTVHGLIGKLEGDSLRAGTALDASREFFRFYAGYDHPGVRNLLVFADSIVQKQPEGLARFYNTVRLHGYWKGLYFLSAEKRDADEAEKALAKIRAELPRYLTPQPGEEAGLVATAVIYDVFSDLSDTKRIEQWLKRVENPEAIMGPIPRQDSAMMFLSKEGYFGFTVDCGKFLCNRLPYDALINMSTTMGESRGGVTADFHPVKFFLCQAMPRPNEVSRRFEQDMVANLRTSKVSIDTLYKEMYKDLLRQAGAMQHLTDPKYAPLNPLETRITWTDLFDDPGTVLSPSLLTSGTYKSYLFNTELLIGNTLTTLCPPADKGACELALGRFLFEYAAPYNLAQARRYLAEGLKGVKGSKLQPNLAALLSDSGIAPVYVPAFHVLVRQATGQDPSTKVLKDGPVSPSGMITCLNQADQRSLDSLTAGLAYNSFANPAALWLSRWANPQTQAPLQQGLHGLKPEVRQEIVAVARQSLLVTDSTLPGAASRKDSLGQVGEMNAIQLLLAHRRRDVPTSTTQPTTRGGYGKASASLVPYLVVNDENFSQTARQAVASRQIEDDQTGALHQQMVDMYSLSGHYWPAYKELENVYSVKSELYLLNTLLFDDLNLRHADKPELAYYYRRYLLGYTSVKGYW